MITKKINSRMIERFLTLLHRRYIKKFDVGTRHLKEFKVSLLAGGEFVDEMPEICEYDESTNTRRYRTVDLLSELEARGHVECLHDNVGPYYALTLSGYQHASRSRLARIVVFLNDNAGILALLTLIATIIGTYVSYVSKK